MKKKLSTLQSITGLLGLLTVSCFNLAYADSENKDKDKDKDKDKNEENGLSGCYTVTRGYYEIAKAVFLIDGQPSPREIGRYRIVLKQDKDEDDEKKERHALSGPLLGHPYAMQGSTFLTRHIFGTYNRTGTFTANQGSFNVLSGSCPDQNGNPQFVDATETTIFSNAVGTGKYTGIESGSITWVGTVNACDDPSNRVGDFVVESGYICFK